MEALEEIVLETSIIIKHCLLLSAGYNHFKLILSPGNNLKLPDQDGLEYKGF